MPPHRRETGVPARDGGTGAAWLSSARAVRCWVKSPNERNPRGRLVGVRADRSGPTAARNAEEGGDDVKSARPLRLGRHTHYNGRGSGWPPRERALIPKPGLSSDRRLQLACVKLELLVTAGQHTAVNTFPGLVHTARHTMEAGNT